jgi:CRP-like cAMP-binding protein
MFVLVDGIVKVTALGSDEEELFVDVQARGDTVGELSALNPFPTPLTRSATVMAAGGVEAIQISKRDLDSFFSAYPDATKVMAFMLGGRQRQKLRERLNMTGFDVRTRLARTLVALAETLGVQKASGLELSIPLSQIELANLVAVAEPTVQKALRDLRVAGAIQTRYLGITITDMDALLQAGHLPA